MAISTVDEYLSALQECKLLAAEQFAVAQGMAASSPDAAALAHALAHDKLISRWQAGTLLALGPRAQLRLGKYKLIERLGKGGMGTVFLAEHETMNRRVALKIVPRSIAEDRVSLDRFFAEARAIAALDHPNIVQAYSVDNEMDRYFIVMEFIDGQDLQRMVELGGPLEVDRAANYIRQAAEGLAHAHARNLVHCDIKPSNLLVNQQGVIKILDLGLARLNQSDEPRRAADGPAIGTVDYMAPEQGLGTADFDHRADIYSLGCTLYFLLTGHPPFPEGTLAQRIVKHQTQPPRDILLERPDAPPALADICRRMLAKEPAGRYPSMLEVGAALSPLLGVEIAPLALLPRAVKLVEETPIKEEADDWLAALVGGKSPPLGANGAAKDPAEDAPVAVRSAPAMQVSPSRETPGRRHAGTRGFRIDAKMIAVAGALALAVVAAVAALPLLLSQPPSDLPRSSLAKASGAAKPLEDAVSRPNDSAPAAKPVTPSPAAKAVQPTVKTGLEKTMSPATNNGATTPETPAKPDANPAPTTTAAPSPSPAATAGISLVSPVENPNTPAASAEIARPVSLEHLLQAVDLPLPKATSGVKSLGKLESSPKPDIDVLLDGGESIAKGAASFQLHRSGDGGPPEWSIVMTEKNKAGVAVARVFLDGGQCNFQWTADAKERASLLRYCGLEFTSGTQKHVTALTAPKIVSPLVIDLDTAVVRQHPTHGVALPDASLLRLQIMPLDPSLPSHVIKVLDKGRPGRSARGQTREVAAGDTVPPNGQAMIVLTKGNVPPVTFTITFTCRAKEVLLEMEGETEISGRKVPFQTAALREFAAAVDQFFVLNERNKALKKPTASAEQIKSFQAAKTEVKALEDLAAELGGKAWIPFRVYVATPGDDASDHKVVIFESGPPPAAKVPAQRTKGSGPKGRTASNAGEANLK